MVWPPSRWGTRPLVIAVPQVEQNRVLSRMAAPQFVHKPICYLGKLEDTGPKTSRIISEKSKLRLKVFLRSLRPWKPLYRTDGAVAEVWIRLRLDPRGFFLPTRAGQSAAGGRVEVPTAARLGPTCRKDTSLRLTNLAAGLHPSFDRMQRT